MLGLGTYDSDEDVEDCKINSTEQSATISSTAKIEAPHSDSELHVHNGRSAIEDSIHSMSSSLDEKNSKSSGLLTMQVELERYVYSHLDELPPSPLQAANPNTIWKISEYLELKELNGFNLTENIRSKKNFGNPYIFGKAVEHFQIDEIGSNYPKETFDPHGYLESDFEANIKKRYSNMNSTNISTTAKLSKPISAIQKIQSLSNQGILTQLQSSSNGQIPPSSNAGIDVPKKRSRWDTTSGVEAIGKSHISTVATASGSGSASVTVAAARIASVTSTSTSVLSVPAASSGVKRNLSGTSLGGSAMTISLPSLPQSRGAGGASAGRFMG